MTSRYPIPNLSKLWSSEPARRKLLERLSLAGLVLIFLVVNLFVLRPGVYGARDSPRYVAGGEDVARGSIPMVYKGSDYMGYMDTVAVSTNLGAGLYGVVVIQLVVYLLAIFALYDLGRKLGGHWTGIVAGGLLAADLWLGAQAYQILTESLYTSLIVLSVWTVFQAVEHGGLYYLLCLPVLALTVLLRPNGAVLLPIVLIYWAHRKIPDVRWRWAVTAGILIAFVLFAVLPSPLRSNIDVEKPLRPFQNGVTVWGETYWHLSMPKDRALDINSWASVVLYIIRYPAASAELMLLRLVIHFANVRPTFTNWMNVSSILWTLWIYPLAVLGFIQQRKHPLAGLCAMIIVVHAGIVALTFADANGRFVLYTLPLFYLYAASAITRPGIPAKSILWKAIQGLGLAVVIIRVATGPELLSQMTEKSFLIFGGPPPATTTFAPAQFNDNLTLLGTQPIESPIRAGTSTYMILYWQADKAMTRHKYFMSIQLLDDAGISVGSTDHWLGDYFYRQSAPFYTSMWFPGLRISNWTPVDIPANAPHTLNVYLSLVTGENNRPVTVTPLGGQKVDQHGLLLQTIEISP